MENQCIQFGQYLISTDVLNIIFPLIGTIIGGLISFYSISELENRKWKQQKIEKYQEEYREAIASTIEWIDPIKNAIDEAQMVVADYVMGRRNEEEYVLAWPKILGHPGIKDPPKRLRILLPEKIYPKFMSIVQSLDRVETLPLGGKRGTKEFGDNYFQTRDKLDQLQQELNDLENYLINEYKKSIIDTPRRI
jgi:hypothetical protein